MGVKVTSADTIHDHEYSVYYLLLCIHFNMDDYLCESEIIDCLGSDLDSGSESDEVKPQSLQPKNLRILSPKRKMFVDSDWPWLNKKILLSINACT